MRWFDQYYFRMAEANITFWCEFIDIYQYWRAAENNDDNPTKSNAAQDMFKKLKEIEPKATWENLNEIAHNLRIAYRKELKKLEESKKSKSQSNLYKPLWFFPYLNFLENTQKGRVIIPLIEDCTLENTESTEQSLDDSAAFPGTWEAQYLSMDSSQQEFARRCIIEILHQGIYGELNAYSNKSLQSHVMPKLEHKQLKVPKANIAFWSEFIDILKFCPALWDKTYKSGNYTHTTLLGRKMLLMKLREIEPKAIEEDVREVIVNMRIAYRKELQKLCKSKDLYKPLWFFDELSFLEDQESDQPIMPSIYDCSLSKKKCKIEEHK